MTTAFKPTYPHPALRATLDELLANPHLHDQGGWITWSHSGQRPDITLEHPCGTAFCLAGLGAWRAGFRPVTLIPEAHLPDDEGSFIFTTFWMKPEEGAKTIDLRESQWRVDHDITHVARDLFGVTGVEAGRLFAGDNTLGMLRAMVADLEDTNGLEAFRIDREGEWAGFEVDPYDMHRNCFEFPCGECVTRFGLAMVTA